MQSIPPANNAETMTCMEVWGGSQPIDSHIQMAGLDAWVYCKPFEGATAGGDVYYVSSCATGRITRLLVADVAGHGAESEEPARVLRDLMRKYVNYLDQTRFVEEMNRKFVSMSKCGCFATAIVTTFFATNGQLSICNAGHPPPLIYRAATKSWSFLQSNASEGKTHQDFPLGVLELVDYRQGQFSLDAGDMLICYTDSLIEAKKNGEWLGMEGLLEIARGLKDCESPGIVPRLLDALAAECADSTDADDLTVLAFRATGQGRKIPLLVRVLAPLRIARGFAGAVRNRSAIPWPELSLPNIGGAFVNSLGNRWRGNR